MIKSPIVSVIVPIYNTGPYLWTCLNSILNQTLSDIEVICINDGSTDDSVSILSSFSSQDPRISVFTTSNHGLGAARNLGLSKSNGEYIMFVDSDDSLAPTACQELLDAISIQPEIDLAISCADSIYESDDMRVMFESTDSLLHNCLPFSGVQTVDASVISQTTVTATSKLWKRNMIERLGLKFPENTWFEDSYFFYCYMVHARKINYIAGGKLYRRLRRHGSITTQAAKKDSRAIEIIHVANLIYDKLITTDRLTEWKDLLIENFERSYQIALTNSTPKNIKSIKTLRHEFYMANKLNNYTALPV